MKYNLKTRKYYDLLDISEKQLRFLYDIIKGWEMDIEDKEIVKFVDFIEDIIDKEGMSELNTNISCNSDDKGLLDIIHNAVKNKGRNCFVPHLDLSSDYQKMITHPLKMFFGSQNQLAIFQWADIESFDDSQDKNYEQMYYEQMYINRYCAYEIAKFLNNPEDFGSFYEFYINNEGTRKSTLYPLHQKSYILEHMPANKNAVSFSIEKIDDEDCTVIDLNKIEAFCLRSFIYLWL